MYSGPSSGSEPETIATSNELIRLGTQLKAAVSFHSYGEMVLHPYGYTDNGQCIIAPDSEDLVSCVKL